MISGGTLKPVFSESFSVPIPLNKLYTKTLQVNVLSVVGEREEIIVSFIDSASLKAFTKKFLDSSTGLCSSQFGRIQRGRFDA